jgi:hypothetical protein
MPQFHARSPSARPLASTSADSSWADSSWAVIVGSCRGRVFVDPQQPACALPADTRHPGAWVDGGRCDIGRCRAGLPPREMLPRAPGIDARRGAEVLPEVEQHVDHAHPHVARRGQLAGVVPIADDLPLATEDAVDGQRQPDGQPVHAAPGPARLIPLDDEMGVVLLNREVNHPEAIDGRPRDGVAERSKDTWRAKRGQSGRGSDRDLHRESWVNLGSSDVRHRRSLCGAAARFSAGPLASTAPCSGGRDRQSHLTSPSRLDSAHVSFSARLAAGCGAHPLDSPNV